MAAGPAVVAVSLKRRTQDAWGTARDRDGTVRAAWVLDGATPLGASDPRAAGEQVSRFAWALSAALRQELTPHAATRDGDDARGGARSQQRPIAEVVESARAQAQASVELGWPGAGTPTATLSLVRRTRAGLECFVLGDSPLWVDGDATIRSIEDPQFASNEHRLIEHWHRLRGEGRSAEDAYAVLLEGQSRDRATRSTEGGIWILGDSRHAAAHGTVELLPGDQPRRVCLLSDGLERVVEPFAITDRRGLFEAMHGGFAGVLAQELRRLERADARRVAAPRLTAHDDVTGLAITL